MATTVSSTKDQDEKDTARLWWRIVRGTWRGTRVLVRNAYIDGRVFYGQTKTKVRSKYKAWQRERNFKPEEIDFVEADEVPSRRRRLLRAQYLCFACNRKYSSAHGLNKHFSKVHGSEPLPRDNPGTSATSIWSRDGAQRVWSRSKSRSDRRATSTTRSTMGTTSSGAAQAMKAAWAKFRDSRPTRLSEIRADLIGIEQALGAYGAEAIAEYRAHLLRLNFDPGTLQNLVRATEEIQKAAKLFSATVAVVEDFYAPDIAAARARAGGAKPADSTLAS